MPKLRVSSGLLVALLLLSKFAETSEHDEVPLAWHQLHESCALQGKSKIPWRQAVGQQVVAQGIAWGKSEKGLGDRVILDGTTIYVAHPVVFDKEGRLVEVSGKLQKLAVPPAPVTSQGFGPKGLEYYAITEAKWHYIDEVTSPRLVLQAGKASAK